MKFGNIIAIVLVVLLAVSLLPAAVAGDSSSAPQLPAQIYGTVVDKNGVPLPVGTIITATVDGREFTYIVTEEGKIGEPGTFGEKFLVHGEYAGSTIEFAVGGEPAGELTTYSPGKSMEFDLDFPVDADNLPESAIAKPAETPSVPSTSETPSESENDTSSGDSDSPSSESDSSPSVIQPGTSATPSDSRQTVSSSKTETKDPVQSEDVETSSSAGDTGDNPVEAVPSVDDTESQTDVQTPGFPFGLLMGALAFAVFLSRRE